MTAASSSWKRSTSSSSPRKRTRKPCNAPAITSKFKGFLRPLNFDVIAGALQGLRVRLRGDDEDVDLFHDEEAAVIVAAQADTQALQRAGYHVEVQRPQEAFVRAFV